jgi:hypothetical protein
VLGSIAALLIARCSVAQLEDQSSATDKELAQRAYNTAWQSVTSVATVSGRTLYISFEISGSPPAPRQYGGFAPPVPSPPAQPFSRNGVMAIETFEQQAYTIRPGDASGDGWLGEVSIRIRSYALYNPSYRRWQNPTLAGVHFWKWKADQFNGQFEVIPEPDAGGTYVGPIEFIASVYGVPPDSVDCQPASLASPAPEQPGTGAGCPAWKTTLPDGSCGPAWRPHY